MIRILPDAGSEHGFSLFPQEIKEVYNPTAMQAPTIVFLVFISSISALSQPTKKEPNFPTGDEIQLVVSQADRAFKQYEASITLEENIPSMQEDKTGIERDRQIVSSSKLLLSRLKRNPNIFNGVGGLLLLSTLDDASRNAALCGATTFADIASGLMSEKGLDRAKAYELMHIGQACQAASVQLYTVSENVHALLLREMEGQQLANEQAMDTLNRCTAILKNLKKSGEGSPK